MRVHLRTTMDDPWANAWQDRSHNTDHLSSSSWTLSPHQNTPGDVQESDIGVPAWSTGVGVPWGDPTALEIPRWDYQHPSDLWSAPSRSEARSVSSPLQPPPELVRPPSPASVKPSAVPFVPPSPSPPSPSAVSDDISHDSEPSSHDERADTPDAFGTFEEAATDAPWAQTRPLDSDTSDWAPSWGSGTATVPSNDEQPLDEWEAARKAKEEQDSRVVRVDSFYQGGLSHSNDIYSHPSSLPPFSDRPRSWLRSYGEQQTLKAGMSKSWIYKVWKTSRVCKLRYYFSSFSPAHTALS